MLKSRELSAVGFKVKTGFQSKIYLATLVGKRVHLLSGFAVNSRMFRELRIAAE